ncbi:pyrroline-5-carboxylate reductase [Poseidonibacter antarcticus]|uniref:pyrroline-5-carboxylate reductase n=1 Tax=Poseidonibacter antarcticus TaxID=2478538 RepID=UPI000EF4B5BF|nr:pyrroline-5-carboxylate reductase [Poseidonibacter antarcticus]
MKLTLIGNGIMAQSLARGLVKNHEVEMVGRDENKLKAIQENIPEITIKTLEDQESIEGKNVLFCVKPYALQSVSARLTGEANILLSILAGTTLDSLRKQIKSKYYIRTMPNVAASVQNSMTTITGDKEAKNIALDICASIGKTLWVNTENQLDIATAIAGSGPAFLALIAEAISDGAVNAGLERNLSRQLVQGLFSGTASLLEHTHPAIIKDSVMSPGGTTAAGYVKLEEGAVRDSMIKAINAAYSKAVEFGKK